jgi:hypothetical protein
MDDGFGDIGRPICSCVLNQSHGYQERTLPKQDRESWLPATAIAPPRAARYTGEHGRAGGQRDRPKGRRRLHHRGPQPVGARLEEGDRGARGLRDGKAVTQIDAREREPGKGRVQPSAPADAQGERAEDPRHQGGRSEDQRREALSGA